MAHSPLYVPTRQPGAPSAPVPPRRRPAHPRRPHSQPPLVWILSTIVLSAVALAPKDLSSRFSRALSSLPTQQESIQPWVRPQATQTCQSMLNADQRLSRDQLTQFLSIAQASSQATIHETIAPPYCTLSKAHQSKQSEAYPLAFDPDTWFVVNYDQGVYNGYDFVFRE